MTVIFEEGIGKGFAPDSDKESPETRVLLGSSGPRLQANLMKTPRAKARGFNTVA
jgi:hypothetical protein